MKSNIKSLYKKANKYFESFFLIDFQESLMKQTHVILMIFDNELYNLKTGEVSSLKNLSSSEIAKAAKKMVEKKYQKFGIGIFLPSKEFIATQYSLPEVNKIDILNALIYQQEELLPSCQQSLMLSVSHDEASKENTALWFSTERANSLYDAFFDESLTLSVIFPRSMIYSNKKSSVDMLYYEKAEDQVLLNRFRNGKLKDWKNIILKEYESEAFRKQWDESFSEIDLSNVTQFDSKDKWLELKNIDCPVKAYGFYPQKAVEIIEKKSKFKKGRVSGIFLLIMMLLVSIPFIFVLVEYNVASYHFSESVESSKQISKMRNEIFMYEDNWEAFDKFPQVKSSQIILTINNIIPKNSWLSSIKVKNGFVELEGYSPNPSEILELLDTQEDYANIAFNQNIRSEQGKNKDYFGITFRILGIDEKSYYEEYFLKEDK